MVPGPVASAAAGNCPSAPWVLRSAPVINHSTGANIGTVATYANTCNQYWAQVKLKNELGAGQWGNAFIDVYVGHDLAGRLTCDESSGGNEEISQGQTSCYTGYFSSSSTGITFQSHGYIYNYPSSMFASGITQTCSRWECIN